MPRIPAQKMIDFGTRIFEAAGAPAAVAQHVSASLVKSDLYGVYSHGIGLLPGYVNRLKAGRINPHAQPTIVKENAWTALIDGQENFGQIVATYAMHVAIEKAKANGVASVSVLHSNHIGRIGEYVETAAHHGLIGLAMVNATHPIVTVYGGVAHTFGTNPIAFAAPVPNSRPILLDFATSTVAGNKVRVAVNKGVKIPKDWILDNEGAETDDPRDLFNNGYLLPVAAHKGYGLGLMVEVFAGLLSGTGSALHAPARHYNGCFFMALSPDLFRPSEDFLGDLRRLVDELHAVPPRPGVERVMVAGDPEAVKEADQRANGIDLDEASWQTVLDAGQSVGVVYEV
jgi:uncharacterized oxidoreductase